jgi:cytochrome c-type biogenesis protein CcmE
MDVNPSDGLDLTPRTGPGSGDGPDTATRRGRRGMMGLRRWVGVAVLVGVVGVGGAVVAQALNDATLFFRNADEAVDQRDELGTSRFRLQGLVVPGSVEAYPGGVEFDVAFNGVVVPVEHSGDPVELFDDDIPVVLEGRWSGTNANAVFLSDRMLVKHDENYVADNSDRVTDAGDGSGKDPAYGPGYAPGDGSGDGSDYGSGDPSPPSAAGT